MIDTTVVPTLKVCTIFFKIWRFNAHFHESKSTGLEVVIKTRMHGHTLTYTHTQMIMLKAQFSYITS